MVESLFIYSIQEMINCIGGVQVLFPLLELLSNNNNNNNHSETPQSSADKPKEASNLPANHTSTDSRSPVMVDGKVDDEWEVLPSSSYSGQLGFIKVV